MEKERRNNLWRRRRATNPFSSNVGLANRMKALDLDPDDPNWMDPDSLGPDVNPVDHVATVMETTKRREAKLGLKGQWMSKAQVAKLVAARKRVWAPKDPHLLTWAEERAVAHLHRTEPRKWTLEALAESFPATLDTIKRVVRIQGPEENPWTSAEIEDYDARVRSNWKLLAKGHLEVSPELKARLTEGSLDAERRLRTLSARAREQLREEIEEKNRLALLSPMTSVKCGEFGQIIRSYKEKVERKKQASKATHTDVREKKYMPMETSDVFLPFPDPYVRAPTPYGETAVVNTDAAARKEEPMTAEDFRRRFLDGQTFSKILNRQTLERELPLKAAYHDWLREERRKDDLVLNNQPKALSARDVLGKAAVDQLDEGRRIDRMRPARGEDNDSCERVSITARMRASGAKTHRIKDVVYDDQGQFLYRIPTETLIM